MLGARALLPANPDSFGWCGRRACAVHLAGLDEEPDPAMPARSPKGVPATMRRGRPVTKVVDPWETPLCYPALCREPRGRDRMLGSVPQTPERSGGDQHQPGRRFPEPNHPTVQYRKGYDHAKAQRQLTYLDTELDRRNPGGVKV